MIDNELRFKKINGKKYHISEKNINELIESFEYSGIMEFHYDIVYDVWRSTSPDGRYLPAICARDFPKPDWQYFETWEDLIENYKFPDGKTMLELLFEE